MCNRYKSTLCLKIIICVISFPLYFFIFSQSHFSPYPIHRTEKFALKEKSCRPKNRVSKMPSVAGRRPRDWTRVDSRRKEALVTRRKFTAPG